MDTTYSYDFDLKTLKNNEHVKGGYDENFVLKQTHLE